jgi:hypothetical protein
MVIPVDTFDLTRPRVGFADPAESVVVGALSGELLARLELDGERVEPA